MHFPSLNNCQKRLLWTHKEVDLAPHSVVDLVLQIGDVKKFPQALGLKSLDPFFQSQQAGSTFHSNKEGWRCHLVTSFVHVGIYFILQHTPLKIKMGKTEEEE